MHNLPILRVGHIASIPKIDFNNQSQFVIDAQVFPGSSGSPLFTTLEGKFMLLGVVSQTMVRNQNLQAIPAVNTNSGIQEVIGLGIVIKAPLIKELIDLTVEDIKRSLSTKNEPVVEQEHTAP